MRRRHNVGFVACVLLAAGAAAVGPASARREENRPPLWEYLHVLHPIEVQAEAARDAGAQSEAYRLYLRALRGYQALDARVPNWDAVEPLGLGRLVREGLARSETAVAELRSAAEEEDAFLQRLRRPVSLDVTNMHIRDVCRILTEATDVKVWVNETLFPEPGPDPNVTIRVDQQVPLLEVVRLIAQQKGLAYAVEAEDVYIGTRTEIDAGEGFSSTAWFTVE